MVTHHIHIELSKVKEIHSSFMGQIDKHGLQERRTTYTTGKNLFKILNTRLRIYTLAWKNTDEERSRNIPILLAAQLNAEKL